MRNAAKPHRSGLPGHDSGTTIAKTGSRRQAKHARRYLPGDGGAREAAGPETYEHRLVRALAAIDRVTEYHVFCLDQATVRALGIDQPNFIFHVLWPENR